WPGDVLPGTPQWERCRALFTSDVNAAAPASPDWTSDRSPGPWPGGAPARTVIRHEDPSPVTGGGTADQRQDRAP
ncbi:hypothetical protein ACFWYN_04005, partial [[Kitasatospora] papulosa]